MAFAIEEINRDPALLPNITLGYRLYDNCVNLAVALRAATALISGEEDSFTDYSCTGTPPVLAIVGDPGSTHSIAVSRMLSPFRVPLVSYYATCSCLSNRKEFPSFFRTIPSDAFQVKAMVQILRHYGWTWVGVIASSDDYGQSAVKSFIEEVNKFGCIAFSETLPSVNPRMKIHQIINTIKQSTARVIVVFSSEAYFIPLAEEIAQQKVIKRQWIASEAWTTSTIILKEENFHSFGGTIGIAIRRGEIPGLEKFLLQVRPLFHSSNNLVKQFWEEMFDCTFQQTSNNYNFSSQMRNKICTASENIKQIQSAYSDVSELRASYNVYKAVYALAHSLHNLMSCEPGKGPFQNNSCADITAVQPWQLLHYLARVNFTTHYGDRVSFDENGDALAIYDVMNWQRADDGSVKTVTIGLFDESTPAGQELTLNEDKIFWNFESNSISYYATCACLSNRKKFPSFFRTIPSDAFQVKAMVQIIRHYGWTWVGVIASNDDYGQSAVKSFTEQIAHFGCISFSETLPSVSSKARILEIVKTIRRSTARVIVVFSPGAHFDPLVEEIVLQNITDRQWIASEAWTTSTVIQSKENFQSFGGTIGIAIRRGEIPGLEKFLLQIQPTSDSNNNLLRQFWENIFDCKFQAKSNDLESNKICSGTEDIKKTKTSYSDVSELRASCNVYKAVYALAHALHNLMSCEPGKGPFQNNSCADITTVQPWQLLHYLARVNFTTHYGDRVSFDENGDALAIYDVMNWQRADDGAVKTETIGLYDESAPAGQELTLNEDKIFWNFESNSPPRSVCSESCQPGTRKATRKGEPLCCFDCVPCAEGEVSNHTDTIECFKCPPDFWSNPSRDQCVPKEIEFLSYKEPLGISLTTVSVFGGCISAAILSVFIYYRNTPVVRANNSELSFLLLLSLILCFLCSLLFMYFLLGYIGLLASVCFLLAFLARNLPDNFNEAKFITFSMLIFCAVWIAFIPAYVSSPGKYSDAVEIFAILASSFGLLIAIFAPKCYIILIHPEKNTKKALMGRAGLK
ncbi:CASR protein, partial [Atractosteus spatula]|nr:CASR protein [Atractosteus spatula]